MCQALTTNLFICRNNAILALHYFYNKVLIYISKILTYVKFCKGKGANDL